MAFRTCAAIVVAVAGFAFDAAWNRAKATGANEIVAAAGRVFAGEALMVTGAIRADSVQAEQPDIRTAIGILSAFLAQIGTDDRGAEVGGGIAEEIGAAIAIDFAGVPYAEA